MSLPERMGGDLSPIVPAQELQAALDHIRWASDHITIAENDPLNHIKRTMYGVGMDLHTILLGCGAIRNKQGIVYSYQRQKPVDSVRKREVWISHFYERRYIHAATSRHAIMKGIQLPVSCPGVCAPHDTYAMALIGKEVTQKVDPFADNYLSKELGESEQEVFDYCRIVRQVLGAVVMATNEHLSGQSTTNL